MKTGCSSVLLIHLMARYYGVNNSELYGSNFSTVLADAPPPLDDTFDEDENEIVFRSDANKSKNYNEKIIASPVKNSRDEFNDQSKLDGSVPNGETSRKRELQKPDVEEDSDFGDFAGFADFGSAFGQDSASSGETQGWFEGNENSVKSFPAENVRESQQEQSADIDVNDEDDEYADFAAFQEIKGSPNNQEGIPSGDFDQRNSNSDWFNESSLRESNNISTNGSLDVESDDDDFGDFTSMENTISSAGESDSKSTSSQPVLELSTSQGRTSTEDNFKPEEVSIKNDRNTVQCNGDLAVEKSDNHQGESIDNHSSDGSLLDAGKEDHNSHRGVSLSEQNDECGTDKATTKVAPLENSLSSTDSDQESFSVAVAQDEYHPIDRSVAVQIPNEQDQTVNNNEGYQKNSLLSQTNGEEEFERVEQDEKNSSKANLHNSSACDHDLETSIKKLLPENNEPNDDSFGEFADFNDHSLQQTSIDHKNDNEEFVDKETDNSVATRVEGVVDETLKTKTVSAVDDEDDDDGFEDFGSFKENHQKEENDSNVVVDSKPKSSSNENEGDDDFGEFGAFESNNEDKPKDNSRNDSFGNFDSFNSEDKQVPSNDQSSGDFGDFGAFRSNAIESRKDDDDNNGEFGDFGGFESNAEGPQKKGEGSNASGSQKGDDDDDEFGNFGSFESNTKDSPKKVECDIDNDFGDFGSFASNVKDSQKVNANNNDFGVFGSFDSNSKESHEDNGNTDDFGDFGSFASNTKDSGEETQSDSFGDFGAFNLQATDSVKNNESDNEFCDFGAFESKEKAVVPNVDHGHLNVNGSQSSKTPLEKVKDNNTFGDHRTSDMQGSGQIKQSTQDHEFGVFGSNSKNLNNSGQIVDDFGDFSGGNDKKSDGFATFSISAARSSVSSDVSSGKSVDLKQQGRGMFSHFSPGISVVIKQAGDPISVCFTSELRYSSGCQSDVLSSRVDRSLQRLVKLVLCRIAICTLYMVSIENC